MNAKHLVMSLRCSFRISASSPPPLALTIKAICRRLTRPCHRHSATAPLLLLGRDNTRASNVAMQCSALWNITSIAMDFGSWTGNRSTGGGALDIIAGGHGVLLLVRLSDSKLFPTTLAGEECTLSQVSDSSSSTCHMRRTMSQVRSLSTTQIASSDRSILSRSTTSTCVTMSSHHNFHDVRITTLHVSIVSGVTAAQNALKSAIATATRACHVSPAAESTVASDSSRKQTTSGRITMSTIAFRNSHSDAYTVLVMAVATVLLGGFLWRRKMLTTDRQCCRLTTRTRLSW
ncbi:hypothetical protein H257_06039 [Aphanomyces astaci]|uniref:Uncharacterized protein n=1 Tax=Aphanomyces astaci TaxID=112090 RepID=W4GRE3_APHAT|nr:hypothetical protein H257_06039 [Aphanomyces astaci]ETV81554.1 hypothetical protein H257_06039 [Aphanomyces astaci]|eukprot:XP_009829412.1 hypothetical protein H257_06039 [Aphanomyces astaci]